MGIAVEIVEGIRGLKADAKDLRSFGLTFLVVLGGLGSLLIWKGRPAGPWIAGSGLLFGAAGLLVPRLLAPLYRLWMALAVVLGAVVSRLLLTLLFFTVLTPIGLLMRLFGRDFLDLRLRDRDSYWHLRDETEYDPSRTEKMF